jgi:hypothetical protein
MANHLSGKILLGSSNIYRLYDAGDRKAIGDFKMIKCTRAETFEAHMSHLGPDCAFVLASVVENFICDAVTNQAEPDAEIVHCLKSFLAVVEEAAKRLPETKFGIVMPLLHPQTKWYQDRVVEIAEKLEGGIKAIMTRNVSSMVAAIKCSPQSSQDFENDGVHLTVASAKIFVDAIISGSDRAFVSGGTDASDAQEADQEEPDFLGMRSLEKRLTDLEFAYKKQVEINFANNLIIAWTREDLDSNSNRSKEDRVVMTGLKSSTVMLVENRARIEWLKKLAMKIFQELVPGFPGKILYLSQGKAMDRFLPMIKVKIDCVAHAVAVRRAFAIKRKEKTLSPELETLFVTNCVNLATRVRIDILKSLARKISDKKDLAYVSGFISRPMMHIKKVGAPANVRPMKSFTYIDAISRFGNLLASSDLTTAYDRAGVAFRGQLSQNFVVLNDADQPNQGSGQGSRNEAGSSRGSGSNRGASGFGSANGKPQRGQKRPGHDLANDNHKK